MVISDLLGPDWKNRDEVKSIKPASPASTMAAKASSVTNSNMKRRHWGTIFAMSELCEQLIYSKSLIELQNRRMCMTRLGWIIQIQQNILAIR
jgi:hypothetical protein